MKLGRVIGSVDSVIKHPSYATTKMLVVQPLNEFLEPVGRTHPAIDVVGAGAGEVVLLVEEGKAAAQMLGKKRIPARTLIIGVVDSVDVLAREETRSGSRVA